MDSEDTSETGGLLPEQMLKEPPKIQIKRQSRKLTLQSRAVAPKPRKTVDETQAGERVSFGQFEDYQPVSDLTATATLAGEAEEWRKTREEIAGQPAPERVTNTPLKSAPNEQLQTLLRMEAQDSEKQVRPRRLAPAQITVMATLFQPREIAEHHVVALLKTVKDQRDTQPVTVLAIGGLYVLVDGHHRLAAYERLKDARPTVPVEYFKGSVMDAVLAAGAANSRAKLSMRPSERMDYAWRLVLLSATGSIAALDWSPTFSKPQISRASSVSMPQVGIMRRVRQKLGAEAHKQGNWEAAQKAARGAQKQPQGDEDWLQRMADDMADTMKRRLPNMSNNPDMAALTFQTYFGRNFRALYDAMGPLVKEDIESDHGFEDETQTGGPTFDDF
jgi:hypothetical protein